jgi:tight adherence protein C
MVTFLTVVAEIMIFVIVTTVAFAAASSADRAWGQRRRLGLQSLAADKPLAAAIMQERPEPNAFFGWVESSTSISDTDERQKLKRELALAGFTSPNAHVWFVIARFGLAIGLPLLFLALQSTSPHPFSGIALIFWALILCGVGLVGPSSFVTRRAAARRTELEFEFPDALDMIVVCVEAGLGLDAALMRVGKEVAVSHPRIAKEFARVTEEIRAGRGRPDALRAMADRTGVDGVKSFVGLIVQTEALGTSVAQTLRTYSTELRETRFLKAEEKAMRVPVLMTVPLVTCILPVIVTALLLPPMIDVMRELLPALEGHTGGK